MSRLPNVGGDENNWGDVLNDFLRVSHNDNGTLKSIINVKTDYGAKGDGSTDDSSAIQNAIDAAEAGGAKIFIPSGRYIIGTTLTVSSFVTIEGASPGTYGVTLDYNRVSSLALQSSVNTNLITISSGAARVTIRDLMLDGNNNNNTDGHIINVEAAASGEESQLILQNVHLSEAAKSCLYIGANRRVVQAYNCVFRNDSASASHTVDINASDCSFVGCLVSAGENTSYDNFYVNGAVAHILGCDIFKGRNGINVNSGDNSMLAHNGIDRNMNQGIYVASGVDALSIIGNAFHSNSQSGNGSYAHVKSDSTGRVSVVGNVFGPLDSGITNKVNYCLQIGSAARAVVWSGNAIADGTFTSGEINAGNFDDQAIAHLLGSMLRTAALETAPRILRSSSQTLTTGRIQFTFFTAYRNMTITNLEFTCATAAGATPTTIKYALYSVASDGGLTLLSATENDTGLLVANNTPYSKALETAQAVEAGDRLAVAILVVSGASMPTISCAFGASSTGMANAPRMAATLSSQTDMPASVASGSLGNDTGYHYVAMT